MAYLNVPPLLSGKIFRVRGQALKTSDDRQGIPALRMLASLTLFNIDLGEELQ
jgi:hypothetical protein